MWHCSFQSKGPMGLITISTIPIPNWACALDWNCRPFDLKSGVLTIELWRSPMSKVIKINLFEKCISRLYALISKIFEWENSLKRCHYHLAPLHIANSQTIIDAKVSSLKYKKTCLSILLEMVWLATAKTTCAHFIGPSSISPIM